MRHATYLLPLAVAAAPAVAADGITTRDPAAFRVQMVEMGYAPDAGEASSDGTTVTYILALKNEKLAAVLAGCTARKECSHIVFAGSFTDLTAPVEWVAKGNADYDLIKLWVNDKGRVAYSAGAPAEGMPRATFRRWVDAITDATDEVAREAVKAGYGPKKYRVSGYDWIGLAGVVMMLIVYGLTVAGRLSVQAWPALAANFVGAGCVLISLSHDFNLSAAVIEGAWALIALGGMIRLLLGGQSTRP